MCHGTIKLRVILHTQPRNIVSRKVDIDHLQCGEPSDTFLGVWALTVLLAPDMAYSMHKKVFVFIWPPDVVARLNLRVGFLRVQRSGDPCSLPLSRVRKFLPGHLGFGDGALKLIFFFHSLTPQYYFERSKFPSR